ncbi:hypothetical protein [Pseudomonas fluorescens]|uniref:hypothetical protein n=1 Tax=Pseudomonas fluorescens TaxID=294 RepID=UPI001BEC402C|nr:hypothetical protein [Pseudomonas fluorescens]MBT2375413.1 hypothetical protein [Pseudomonas fluorescens]
MYPVDIQSLPEDIFNMMPANEQKRYYDKKNELLNKASHLVSENHSQAGGGLVTRTAAPKDELNKIEVLPGPATSTVTDGVPADVLDWAVPMDADQRDRLQRIENGVRGRYKNPISGQIYQKLNGDYYLSDYQNGNHVIYKAGDISHPRVVEEVNGKLEVRPEENRGIGGGKKGSKFKAEFVGEIEPGPNPVGIVNSKNYDYDPKKPLDTYEISKKELKADAQDFYYHQTQQPQKRILIEGPFNTFSTSSMFDDIYQKNKIKGIVVGESHSATVGPDIDSDAAHKFMIRSIPDLVRNNVKVIYIENIAKESSVARVIREAWERVQAGEKNVKIIRNDFQFGAPADLIDEMHNAGIEVKPIDNLATMQYKIVEENGRPTLKEGGLLADKNQPLSPGELRAAADERIRLHNYYATNIIQDDQKTQPGNWIAFQGTKHIDTTKGVPGTAQLNNAIPIEFEYNAGSVIPKIELDNSSGYSRLKVTSSGV